MTAQAQTHGGAPLDGDAAAMAVEVAWASRILAMHGYEDLTLGHVSPRAAPTSAPSTSSARGSRSAR